MKRQAVGSGEGKVKILSILTNVVDGSYKKEKVIYIKSYHPALKWKGW